MFCIKCGMMLDNSAKSCPACGTKMVFPEGFTPEGSPSPAPKAEVILSNEPPHAPDDFDLSKANITYNGKTMLINDEPEIDLDMTMAAPRVAPAAPAPVYSQPVYQAPSSYIPSPVPAAQEEETAEEEAPKSKSKLPLIIGISIAVLVVAVVAIVMLVGKGADEKETNAPSSPAVSNVIKPENSSATLPADGDFEILLVEYPEVPSEELVYIIRDKDMPTFDLADARIGYFDGDAAADEYVKSSEDKDKIFMPFPEIDELKEAIEKGTIDVILISKDLSDQIISKKETDTDIDSPELPDDEDFEQLVDITEQQTAEDSTAPTKPAEATEETPLETLPDAQTAVSQKPESDPS